MKTEELELYQCYYYLQFYDSLGKFPCIRAWVYIGINLQENDEGKWYFQDAESFYKYGIITSYTEEEENKFEYSFFYMKKEMIDVSMFNVEMLIKKLELLSLKGYIP